MTGVGELSVEERCSLEGTRVRKLIVDSKDAIRTGEVAELYKTKHKVELVLEGRVQSPRSFPSLRVWFVNQWRCCFVRPFASPLVTTEPVECTANTDSIHL